MPPAEKPRPALDSRYILKGALLQILGTLGQGLVAVQQVLIPRLFGQATHGIYGGILGIMEVAVRFGVAGTDKGLYKYLGKGGGEDPAEGKRAFASALRLSTLVSSLLAAAMFVGAPFIAAWKETPQIAPALRLMSFGLAPMALVLVLNAAALSKRQAHLPPLIRGVMEPALLTVLTLAAWLSGAGTRGLAMAYALSYVGLLAFALWLCKRSFEKNWFSGLLRAPKHPDLTRFVRPMVTLEVMNSLRLRLDTIFVFAVLPPEKMALYAASEYIGRVAANVRYAFDGIASPLFAEALHSRDLERRRETLQSLTRWVWLLSLPLATTLISLRADLLGLYGEAYVAASAIVVVHVLGHFANGALAFSAALLTMSGRAWLLVLNQAFTLVVHSLLSWMLIPRLGIMGAALAFLAGMLVPISLSLIEAARLEGVHPFNRALLPPLAVGLLVLGIQTLVTRLVSPGIPRILGGTLLGLIGYFALYWLTVFRPEEKESVSRIKKRILG